MNIFDKFFGPPDIDKLKERWIKGDIRGLIKALRHKDPVVRLKAAQALQLAGDTAAKILGAEWAPGEAIAAVFALEHALDAQAVQALTCALHDQDSNVRSEAAKGVAHFRDPRIADFLISCLESAPSAGPGVIRTLRRVGYWKQDMLPEILNDALAEALIEKLRPRLLDSLAGLRAVTLSQSPGFARSSLLELLNRGVLEADAFSAVVASSEAGGAAIRRAVAEVRDQTAMSLMGLLDDADQAVRESAAMALEILGGPVADKALANYPSSSCRSCRAGGVSFRCARCSRGYCEVCIRTFGEKAARILMERVYGDRGALSFGTAKIFDNQGRAFCPHCYGNLLDRAKTTGKWVVQSEDERNPSCARVGS